MSETTIKTATRREHVLVDVKVEADLSGMLWTRRGDSEEERAKGLESAVKDFHDFLRDHRSQDMVTLSVERVYQDLCSECNEIWESNYRDDSVFCAYCGAEFREADK